LALLSSDAGWLTRCCGGNTQERRSRSRERSRDRGAAPASAPAPAAAPPPPAAAAAAPPAAAPADAEAKRLKRLEAARLLAQRAAAGAAATAPQPPAAAPAPAAPVWTPWEALPGGAGGASEPPAASADAAAAAAADDDEIDPLDAYMANEVLPEVTERVLAEARAKAEARLRRAEELAAAAEAGVTAAPRADAAAAASDDDDEEKPYETIEVPTSKVKLIVGAGGENIKWIQKKSKARLQVLKTDAVLARAFGTEADVRAEEAAERALKAAASGAVAKRKAGMMLEGPAAAAYVARCFLFLSTHFHACMHAPVPHGGLLTAAIPPCRFAGRRALRKAARRPSPPPRSAPPRRLRSRLRRRASSCTAARRRAAWRSA
jgi:ElaB/YqjD/DUF883 family membrane-anchored ribosome-binding protein